MSYPSSLDTWVNMVNQSLQAADHLGRHNELQGAIIGLETKLGINSSADATTIDYLLKNSSSSNPGHKHTLAQGATDVTATATQINNLQANAGTLTAPLTVTAAELNVLHGNLGDGLSWSPVWTGFSVDPTVITLYILLGKLCFCSVYPVSNGTGNAGTATMTLPFKAADVAENQRCLVATVNSGARGTGVLATRQNSIIADLYPSNAEGGWANSSTAQAIAGNFLYRTI